jgi:hypothetical protein
MVKYFLCWKTLLSVYHKYEVNVVLSRDFYFKMGIVSGSTILIFFAQNKRISVIYYDKRKRFYQDASLSFFQNLATSW